jgi:PUA domain protein
MMAALQVDRGAIKFVLSAANIMCPGLTSPGAWMPEDAEGLPAEYPVAIFAEGKTNPLAIGWLKLSTADMYVPVEFLRISEHVHAFIV